jgi:hypothetical protein
MPHDKVLDLTKTHLPSFGGIASFDKDLMCLFHRLVHTIGIEEIQSASMSNKPMPSWSANDPRTRGFRDGKFATADLEALISLEDNFEKLDLPIKMIYANVRISQNCMFKLFE